MKAKKFTIFLISDEGSYQVIFPHYPNCITYGVTIDEALKNAREAIELHLEGEAEQGADPVPDNAQVSHVVVAEIEAEVPDSFSNAKRRKPGLLDKQTHPLS